MIAVYSNEKRVSVVLMLIYVIMATHLSQELLLLIIVVRGAQPR